jgi:hypothetical protein
MSIKIFNVKNHKPDGEALRQLSDFSTNDFCGIVGTLSDGASAFTKSGNSIQVNDALLTADEFHLIGGGCLLSVNKSDVADKTADGTYAVKVLFDNRNDNFVADTSTAVSIISDAVVSGYNGRTLWTSTGFIIPLFSVSNGEVTSLSIVKDGKSWEEFVTQDAINQFRAELSSEYTHQIGSTGNNRFGKVANYDFSGDSVRHIVDTNAPTEILAVNSNNEFALPTYDSGALYVEGHSVKSGPLPISGGGTGSTDTLTAKQNLGIYYGNDLPSQHDFGGAVINQGDIYFRILE